MKKYTTSTNTPAEFTVLWAGTKPVGYGHIEITVEVRHEGNTKCFRATTTDMPGYDEATELEGQEKYEALYELVAHSIAERVSEWVLFQD